ncbi:dsDNA break repair ligase [Spathaspora passalidarum NRRL Y-27907]|uniref:DNA ligase n=1 Tax=Spathaspora passalidarum (strain NRRL Y-27907 / 11-Y1) TaxID=619300 RepID=G3AMK2_SPAPN|nr:dsDNA break repair ligase [Spathaspora passalidarum NRRL Y-27907]EGW33446.1 dsDNA break repair ligase [Spathaspora passalidarum NRRL Y-27907]
MPFFLDNVPTPKNNLEPSYRFLNDELFIKLDAVNKQTLGEFKNISDKKAYIINSFIQQFKLHIGNDIYPSARLIFPDKAGRLYYIKDIVLARLIIKMYSIPKDSDDYSMLYNWKLQYQKTKRFTVDQHKLRDLPLQAARIISNRRNYMNETHEFSVADINAKLDALNLAKKSAEQIEILKPLFDTLTIPELRWLIHIILKKTILGFFENYFLNSWHPDASRLYSICNNLQKTVNYLVDPNTRVDPNLLTVHPFYPFKPQLAQKLSSSYAKLIKDFQKITDMEPQMQTLFDKLDLKDKFYIEEKMDGDRMVLHKEGPHFKFYSRRLKDYSFLYGENYEFGSLTKYLTEAFPGNVDSVILDGEMVAYDYVRKAILPFGTLKSSAIQESVRQYTIIDQYEQQSSYPYFLVFDILYLNGRNLTNYPLFFRKNILNKVIRPIPNRFEIHDSRISSSIEDIKRAIREIVGSRSEGLVLKHTQSKYHIGYRNLKWIKLKPEYLEKFGENLDLVVIGKVPGVKNSYMTGLRNETDGSYYSFCMCANGFTNEEFDKIERITHGKWIKTKDQIPSKSVIQFGTKQPPWWINPRDSLVLEIKARSIDAQSEKTFAVGSTLHNMYCRRIRTDKNIDECISMQEYFQLKEKFSTDVLKSQSAALKRKQLHNLDLFNESTIKKQRVESNLFARFNFMIVSDKLDPITGERTSREELMKLVKKYGGNLINAVDVLTADRMLVITEKMLPLCESFINRGIDLIKPNWIFECINRGTILQLEPFFIFSTSNWDKYTVGKVDQFGDSYIIYNSITELSIPRLSDSELRGARKLHMHEWGDQRPKLYLFLDTNFFVVGDTMSAKFLGQRIMRYTGEITKDINGCSYIVVPIYDDEKNRIETLDAVNKISSKISEGLLFDEGSFTRIPFIVTEKFIDQCIKENCIVDPEDYKYYQKQISFSKKSFAIN